MNKESFEPFEKVLVRNNENEMWHEAIFSFTKKEPYRTYFTLNGKLWSYCIPYEGNEHLIDTNNMPTEKPKSKERWRANKGKRYYYLCMDNNIFVEQDWEEDDNDNFHSNPFADEHYHMGNYFRTKKEASEMAKKIKKLLKTE